MDHGARGNDLASEMIDLLCLGRAAVDLYSDQIGSPLESSATFSKYVGGCPANIAIGASRLGLKTGVISGVGSEAMGCFVRETLIKEGVDVSCLVTKEKHLTALVLLGIEPPEHFPLIFYRENCADMAVTIDDLPEEAVKKSRALLVSGTHCSTETTFALTKKAISLNPANVILDIDYRPVLWGAVGHEGGEDREVQSELFAERMQEIIPLCKLIVGTEEEICAATSEEDLEKALADLRGKTDAAIVQKRGAQGCIVYTLDGKSFTGKPFSVPLMNVLGAGDAFMSGFLRGYLRGESWERSIEWGNACGALVVSRHGCSPEMPYWEELKAFLNDPSDLRKISNLHFQMGRGKSPKRLTLFAFDHRTFFEGKEPEEVRHFKQLVYQTFLEVETSETGIIVDSTFVGKAQFCCIEEPNRNPLEFLEGREAAEILASWPIERGVKVLVKADERNISQLVRLAKACRKPRRDLLIELIDTDLKKISTMISACYANGVFPDWWKLPPIIDQEGWNTIRQTIEKEDPYCHGILLLGQDLPMIDLKEKVQQIQKNCSLVKGYAVGRTIWKEAAEAFFQGKKQNQDLIEMIKAQMGEIVWQ